MSARILSNKILFVSRYIKYICFKHSRFCFGNDNIRKFKSKLVIDSVKFEIGNIVGIKTKGK